jgi:hypothetical protein
MFPLWWPKGAGIQNQLADQSTALVSQLVGTAYGVEAATQVKVGQNTHGRKVCTTGAGLLCGSLTRQQTRDRCRLARLAGARGPGTAPESPRGDFRWREAGSAQLG